MLLKAKKMRPNLSALSPVGRPLRKYQRNSVRELELKRASIHSNGKLIAYLYFDGEGGIGKDDIMYYFGQYTGLPGNILFVSPQNDHIEKVDRDWSGNKYRPHFRNPRGFNTMTVSELYHLMKRFIEGEALDEKYQKKLDIVKNSGTIFFNEVHTIASGGDDLKMIPVIREGLEQLKLPFTVVNVTACTDDINEKVWGVPKVPNLVQATDTDEWLNPTELHLILCGMKVTWEDQAAAVGIDTSKLNDNEKQSTKQLMGEIINSVEYNDEGDMAVDVDTKNKINQKMKEMHPDIDPKLFTDKAVHLLKLATIRDMIDSFITAHGTDRPALVFSFPNAGNFSYSDYTVDYINTKAKKQVAHCYDSTVHKKERRKIRNEFELNKGSYTFLVCKCTLIEDFNKIDLRFLINMPPCNNPQSSRRKQKCYRVRRADFTDQLDSSTNKKETSHVYQATNIKQMSDLKGKYTEEAVEALHKKRNYQDCKDPKLKQLIEQLTVALAQAKLGISTSEDDNYNKNNQIPMIENDLDKLLDENETYDDLLEKYGKDDALITPPQGTVYLHKVKDVDSGKYMIINNKCWHDIFKSDKVSAEEYAKWARKHFVIY